MSSQDLSSSRCKPSPILTRDLFRLDNRTVMITGGIGAMGLALARAILESGGDVICVDLAVRPEGEEWESLQAVATASSQSLTYRAVDCTDETSISDLFDHDVPRILRPGFPLRGLVTCAGISGNVPAVLYPLDAFRRIVDVNLLGTFVACRGFGRFLLQGHSHSLPRADAHAQGHGHGHAQARDQARDQGQSQGQGPSGWESEGEREDDNSHHARTDASAPASARAPASIVLIASMSGHVTNRGVNTSAYNSSKAAIHQLARSLAAEWGGNPSSAPCPSPSPSHSPSSPSPPSPPSPSNPIIIRVNSISPGYIRTPLTTDTLREAGIETLWEGGNMLGRLSWVDEYRAPVLFLLADGSGFVTGADLRVDGGHTGW